MDLEAGAPTYRKYEFNTAKFNISLSDSLAQMMADMQAGAGPSADDGPESDSDEDGPPPLESA